MAWFSALIFLLAATFTHTAFAAELRIGLSADVTTMDPHFVAAQPNLTVQQHVFEGLIRIDERGRVTPGIAQSWTTPDPLTWVIKLRTDVKFHDGAELTAEDVVYSLERTLTIKGSPGGFASYVKAITAKRMIDRHTLELKTAAPYGPLLQDLAHVLIVSKRSASNASSEDFDSGKAAIGTGPFKLVKFARGDRVQLARHDAYWGGRSNWDTVSLRILPSDPARTAALLSGQLDAIENVPTADLARLRKSAEHRLAQTVSWRTILLHLDQDRISPPGVTDKAGKPLASNPFKDVRVRQALSKALNREALAERVMEGLALPASSPVPPSVIGHDPTLKPERYDPDEARKLLAAAGYPNGFAI
ncbi:MAG: ABC transporter substrate-binding protein, partial [Pseudomonadota bacterium]